MRQPKKVPVTATMHAIMVRELLAAPCTAIDLSAETGLRAETVRLYLRAMRSAGVLYVAAWVPDTCGRLTTAGYRIGTSKDAQRQPMQAIEIKRRYRARQRARALSSAILGDTYALA